MSDPAVVNMPWTRRVLKEGAQSKQALMYKLDSWANAITGLNTARDKTTGMLPYAEMLLSPMLLEALYHTSDIAARIVSALPDEAFKRPFKIVSKKAVARAGLLDRLDVAMRPGTDPEEAKRGQNPVESDRIRERNLKAIEKASTPEEANQANAIQSAMRAEGSAEKHHEAMTWGRLFGLGLILVGGNDGEPSWVPIERDRVRSVDYLTVLDKRDVVPWRWYNDVQAPKFGDIALYQVQPIGVFLGTPYDPYAQNSIILAHESRLIRYGGELTSKRERLRNQGSDYSVLQKCFRALQLTDNNWQSVSALLADASQGVIKIKGLIDMISQESDVMINRMQLVDLMRSVTRSLILDADGEDFTRVATPFGGISDILDQTWSRLSSAARMPKTILMGTSPAGLNATGESDVRWWYDSVASTQERSIKPQLEYEISLRAASLDVPDPDQWIVIFAPLRLMSEKEIADLHFSQAQADNLYVGMGAVLPEEIALSRFGSGEYSLETTIDVESRRRALRLALAEVETSAANDLESAKDPAPTPGEQAKQTPDPKPPGVSEN